MKALGVDEIAKFLNENPELSDPDNADPERMVEYCKTIVRKVEVILDIL